MSHHSPRHKEIAANGLILLTEVGSGLHGAAIAGTDDHDEMGICIPPPECVMGLEKFEQYADRWHADGTRIAEGKRSGHGDTDHTVYALGKWSRLAAQGNPTVLLPLFAPEPKRYHVAPEGELLLRSRDLFLSKDAGWRFHGYLKSQRARMIVEQGEARHQNRRELVEQFGFDTKMAYHALRLAEQGAQLMLRHDIMLPMRPAAIRYLRRVRQGEYTLDRVMRLLDFQVEMLEHSIQRSTLPEHADQDAISDFLIGLHYSFWKRTGQL